MSTQRTEALLATITASLDQIAALKAEQTELREALEQCSALLDILRAETYWTAGIFNSWTEGRGAKEFRNCSIKSVDGAFPSKAEALHAAEKAIKDRMLSGVRWDTAKPTASFRIPTKTNEKIGDIVDAVLAKGKPDKPQENP